VWVLGVSVGCGCWVWVLGVGVWCGCQGWVLGVGVGGWCLVWLAVVWVSGVCVSAVFVKGVCSFGCFVWVSGGGCCVCVGWLSCVGVTCLLGVCQGCVVVGVLDVGGRYVLGVSGVWMSGVCVSVVFAEDVSPLGCFV
jgi:hypothetical protein